MLKRKAAQLDEARRRVARIVNFVALGRAQDSKALAEALAKDEASVTSLEAEVENLQQASDSGVRFPSRAWVEKRLAAVRELLERRTEASGLVLRRLLGRMVLEPVYPEQGAPYYVARTALDVLVLLEPLGSDPGSESGANSFGWWRRPVLHLGPHSRRLGPARERRPCPTAGTLPQRRRCSCPWRRTAVDGCAAQHSLIGANGLPSQPLDRLHSGFRGAGIVRRGPGGREKRRVTPPALQSVIARDARGGGPRARASQRLPALLPRRSGRSREPRSPRAERRWPRRAHSAATA